MATAVPEDVDEDDEESDITSACCLYVMNGMVPGLMVTPAPTIENRIQDIPIRLVLSRNASVFMA